MFTIVTKGILGYFMICCNDGEEKGSETSDDLRPPLDRHSPPLAMPRPRTYGKKKSAGSSAASAIFGAASSPHQPSSPPERPPLADITSQLSSLQIRVDEEIAGNSFSRDVERGLATPVPDTRGNVEPNSSIHPSHLEDSNQSLNSITNGLDPDTIALQPLVRAYRLDCGQDLPISRWEDLLLPGSTITKIAEASYAEVYRVSIDDNDSIIKIMQLRIPSDPKSKDCYTAIEVQQVVSEVRLMNVLTETPGFVTFKGAHLIRGKPCSRIIRAYDACQRWDPDAGLSSFPHPTTFTENSLFLAIELGDAGSVLDEVPLQTIDQVWDVLIGVIVTLACAEHCFEFEHRDLHENNICISRGTPSASGYRSGDQKFGFSGFKVTLLDYGLSRAKFPDGDEVFYDLESDLGVFQGPSGNRQFDTYRRMRTYLFTNTRTMFPRWWHDNASRGMSNGYTWQESVPYTNVLWIRYLFYYVKKNYRESGGDMQVMSRFDVEMKHFNKRLNPKTLVANGAFSSATDVYDYICAEKWITPDQVATMTDDSIVFSHLSGVEDADKDDE